MCYEEEDFECYTCKRPSIEDRAHRSDSSLKFYKANYCAKGNHQIVKKESCIDAINEMDNSYRMYAIIETCTISGEIFKEYTEKRELDGISMLLKTAYIGGISSALENEVALLQHLKKKNVNAKTIKHPIHLFKEKNNE